MSRVAWMLVPRTGAEPARVRLLETAEVTVKGKAFKVAIHASPDRARRRFRLAEYSTGMRLDGITVDAEKVKDYRAGMVLEAFDRLVAKHGAARVADVIGRGVEVNEKINGGAE